MCFFQTIKQSSILSKGFHVPSKQTKQTLSEMSCEFFQQWLSFWFSAARTAGAAEGDQQQLYIQYKSPILPLQPCSHFRARRWPVALLLFSHGHTFHRPCVGLAAAVFQETSQREKRWSCSSIMFFFFFHIPAITI